ncbi:MAG: hypothetical protein KGL74_05790, partial [Elusimicrobia bacterium]|nr:hypothetical protein [Elusimicrobiota bacterium]
MKRHSFWLKAAAAAALMAVLGLGAALVALKTAFPEPKLRAWAVDAARRQLGREVKLDHISAGLGGLSLEGLKISESPDFSAGTFLSVDTFRLRPSWKAALRRKLVIAAVSADGLRVRVTKDARGRYNYETLGSSAAPAGAAAAPDQGPPAELNVRRASIRNGAADYFDAATGSSWTVSGLSLDVSDFGMGGAFPLNVALRVKGRAGGRPVDARIAFDGTVDLARGDRAAFKADVKRLKVEAEGLALDASGHETGLDAPKVSFDGSLSASGKTVLRAKGTAALGETSEFDVSGTFPGLDTRLLAKFAPAAGIPALNLPPVDLALNGRGGGGNWDVKSFRASWSGGKVEGSGSARGVGGKKPNYEGRAAFGVDVPEIKPGQYPFLKLPPKLGVPAGRVDGSVALAGESLTVAALTVKTKYGTANIAGTAKNIGSDKPALDGKVVLALDLPAFRASDLPVAVKGLPPSLLVPAAKVNGAVRVQGDDVRLD